MAAIAAGAAVAAAGGLLASSKARDAGNVRVRGNSTLALDGQLRLLEFLELGGNPEDILLGYRKKGRKAARNDPTAFKVGGSYFRRPDESVLSKLRSKHEQTQFANERRSFERLKSSPFFESLLGDVNGTSPGLAAAISQLGKQTLGGAAQSGLNLEDPVVQARALGPGALQGFLAQRELSRNAGLTGLQLTRGAGTPFFQSNPRPRGELLNQIFQSEQFRQGSKQFNAQNQINSLGLQAGIYGGLGQSFGGALVGYGSESEK